MTPTGYPFIQVFYNATGSKGAATAMSMILVLSSTASAVSLTYQYQPMSLPTATQPPKLTFKQMTNMATASRQLFAFARDKGVPFYTWFATVPSGWDIPLNAIFFTIIFACLFALINIGSTVALNQALSLGLSALLSSYLLSISCVLLRRLRKQPLLNAEWSLGRWGIPVNAAAVCFLILTFVLSFFPPVVNPTPQTMNWASMAFGVVVIIAALYYIFRARFHYVGPVEYVRKGL